MLPTSKGIWRILGEDPNCDLGGSHIQPELGIVKGTFHNVERYAKTLKGWTTWGSGGSIEKFVIPVPTVDVDKLYSKEVEALRIKREAAQAELDAIDREIVESTK